MDDDKVRQVKHTCCNGAWVDSCAFIWFSQDHNVSKMMPTFFVSYIQTISISIEA